MSNSTTERLEYAPPSPDPNRFPRWLVVVAIAPVAAWLLVQIVGILDAPEPAVAARIFLVGNLYEFTAVALCIAAYIIVRRLNQSVDRRLSYLAVLASLAVVLNPSILRVVLPAVGFPSIGRGDSEFRSFAAAVLASVAGIVAWVRIARSPRHVDRQAVRDRRHHRRRPVGRIVGVRVPGDRHRHVRVTLSAAAGPVNRM